MTAITNVNSPASQQIQVSGTQLTLESQPGSGNSPDERKLRKAAGDFESILLASMWKSMKQSFGNDDEFGTDPAHGTLDDWGIEVMSSAVGRAGGLGIGKLILKHLESHTGAEKSAESAQLPKVPGRSADISMEETTARQTK